MYKYVHFRILIEEKLTTRECLTQVPYIQLAMGHLFKIIWTVHVMGNAF